MTRKEERRLDALLVEDDEASLRTLEGLMRQRCSTRSARTLEEARREVAHDLPELVLLDLRLPDGCGADLVPDIPPRGETRIVLMTGHPLLEASVQALNGRAFDVLAKPIDPDELDSLVAALQARRGELDEGLEGLAPEGPADVERRLVGDSDAMRELRESIARVAPTDTAVFVCGETGVGKELVAQSIHRSSARAGRPFQAVNCGAISPTLIESELFGHERGSFTGASRRHAGVFERADGGTIFLDEITEMPLELQVKLLRVLETGVFQRVGGSEPVEVDVRVIAASNRDLTQAVRDGELREDLLYRLFVFPIHIPPLRERQRDVVALARVFHRDLERQLGVEKPLREDALERLVEHEWPGNVRELRNALQRAFILAEDEVQARHLDFLREPRTRAERARMCVGMSLDDVERNLFLGTLELCRGDKRRAAEILGVSLKTVYNRLNRYAARDRTR